jgi:4,5-dihydroxyphthalate decarboxylase
MKTMRTGFSRRSWMKTTAAGVAAGVWSAFGSRSAGAAGATTRSEPDIKIAGYDYDRVRPIVDARVGLQGFKVTFDFQDIYKANQTAFGPERTYEITEIGLIPYVTKFINEDFRAYRLVPVFISRLFRHRNLYVHADSGIEEPGDLRGKRVGTPGYGSSANTWIRGLLRDEYGIGHDEIQWIETVKSSDQGAVTGGGGFSAFEGDGSPYFLPDDFPLVQGPPGVDESELLLSGGCDALIAPITPKAFQEGNPKIRQLFRDAPAVERAYFKKTGVFPIMHAVAIRTDAIETDPGLPKAVFEMYSRAKQMAYANMETTTSLKVSLPWVSQELEETRELMGRDFWRYGIEANRKELELVMRYTHEQGLVKRLGVFEEMFDPSTLSLLG